MPPCASSAAPRQAKPGQLELKHVLVVERGRLSSVLARFEEEHGTVHSEPCLMCLESIHVTAVDSPVKYFLCCGGFICTACMEGVHESEFGFWRCPLCRESIDETTEAESGAKLVALAERGVAWAQKDMGKCMIDGIKGFVKQKKAGLEWLDKAADRNYPPALYELSMSYRYGSGSSKRKSQEKANELLLQSANLGHSSANSELAAFYFDGTDGFGEDRDEAYFRASVAFALDDTNYHAAHELWRFHHDEQNVPESSLYLACYYLNIVANKDENGIASFSYSIALVELIGHLQSGQSLIPGSNALPAIFFWLRKSRDLGHNHARGVLKKWECDGQRYCANCSKEAQTGEKFKQCSKCKAEWYCSKGCQVDAWKAGHKNDCKRARILNFDDYLNAD